MQANMAPKPRATPGAARKSRHPDASHCHGASKATRLMATTAEGLDWTISSAIMALRLHRPLASLWRNRTLLKPWTEPRGRLLQRADASNLHLRPHWLPVLDLDQTTTAAGSARAACKGSRKLVSVEPPRCLARRITQQRNPGWPIWW